MARSTKITPENRDKYVALGLNIAYYRKRTGITQEELAELAGISRSYLGVIEAPNMVTAMSLEVVFNLANALNIPVKSLFEFRE